MAEVAVQVTLIIHVPDEEYEVHGEAAERIERRIEDAIDQHSGYVAYDVNLDGTATSASHCNCVMKNRGE